MTEKTKDYDVFISYEKTTGSEVAEHLQQALERAGISAFYAERDIPLGKKFDGVIQSALDTCSIFIVILTANASASDYVQREIGQALQREAREELQVIPCRSKGLRDEDVPEAIKDAQMINFSSKEDLADKVVSKTRKGVARPPVQREVAQDAGRAGVKRIFTNRRCDPECWEEIERQIVDSREILMMANSLRDFFGGKEDAKHNDAIVRAGKKRTKFRLLLLNPLSEAAKDRAIIESGTLAKDDEAYVCTPLFRDIQRVATWLHEHRTETNDKIETRFSSLTPTVLMIKTDKYTFIEPYHIGSLRDAGIETAKGDEQAYCLGGYVPILMVEDSYPLANLMRSHFENAWDKAEEFDAVFTEIEEFSKHGEQKNYRRRQFIDEILRKASDLR